MTVRDGPGKIMRGRVGASRITSDSVRGMKGAEAWSVQGTWRFLCGIACGSDDRFGFNFEIGS